MVIVGGLDPVRGQQGGIPSSALEEHRSGVNLFPVEKSGRLARSRVDENVTARDIPMREHIMRRRYL